MSRKKKIPAPIVALVMATGQLTGVAALPAPAQAANPVAAAPAQGVIKQRSDYGFDETVVRLKADIAAKGIRFFDEIDHAKLGAGANLQILAFATTPQMKCDFWDSIKQTIQWSPS